MFELIDGKEQCYKWVISSTENNITNRNLNNNNNKKQQTFKGGNGLNGVAKAADLFIKSQENLSSTRFIQDTITNWAPKAVFSRSVFIFFEPGGMHI